MDDGFEWMTDTVHELERSENNKLNKQPELLEGLGTAWLALRGVFFL